jgi:hypothetical protein
MREGELDTGLLNRLAGSIPEDWKLIQVSPHLGNHEGQGFNTTALRV